MSSFSRRIGLITVGLALFGMLCLAYAYFIEPRRLVVHPETITIVGWPSDVDNFRIVSIGDIHGGSNGVDEAKIRRVVEIANAQNADLIVLLGDYVSQKNYNGPIGDDRVKMPVDTVIRNLAGLHAKYGVMVIMGNHDDWYGSGAIINGFRSLGYTVLDDQIATVNAGNANLRILGLRDQLHVQNWQQYSDRLKQVIAGSVSGGPIIALEHSPDVLPIITGALSISPDLKLMLAAHTHGGQVWLPVLGTPIVPSSYGQKYSHGHVRENGVDMFVTSGIGESILPFRFMVPPEVAVLTIRPQ